VESCLWQDLDLNLEDLQIDGEHGYGYEPLLEAIAAKYRVREENVVSTLGASQALFSVCAVLLQPGNEVLIEKPVYEPLLSVPRAFGAKILRFGRKYKQRYEVNFEEFASLLSSRTKLVILTNLHNPSGALLSRPALRKLAAAAEKKKALILVDEIYLEFLDGEEGETSFSLAPNLIVISSLTKVYGLGGLRCGWILAPAQLAERMRKLMDYILVEGVFIGEQISAKVFVQLDSIKAKNKPLIEKNKSMIRDFIQGEERLSWIEPAQGVVCFPRVEAPMNGDNLAELLQEKYDTSVVPGSFFEEPQHFRLGYGLPSSLLAEGLENIRKALREF